MLECIVVLSKRLLGVEGWVEVREPYLPQESLRKFWELSQTVEAVEGVSDD
jgi:hypothetical protein